VGIITDSRIAKKIQAVFEADWEQSAPKSETKEPAKEDQPKAEALSAAQ
jgi:hypothetical protein